MRCLAPVVAALALFFATHTALIAEQMPDSAPGEMAKILDQKEFHPRGYQLTAWERIKAQIWAKLSEIVSDLWRKISFPEIELPDAPWLVSTIKVIADFFSWLGDVLFFIAEHGPLIIALIVCVFIAYRLLKYLGDLDTGKLKDAARAASGVFERPRLVSPKQILSMGFTFEALIALRRLLREEFYRRYQISDSVTDRQVARKLPTNEKMTGIFSAVSSLFEQQTFAGRPVDQNELRKVLTEFEQSSGSSKA